MYQGIWLVFEKLKKQHWRFAAKTTYLHPLQKCAKVDISRLFTDSEIGGFIDTTWNIKAAVTRTRSQNHEVL
jgi:hypothetical protein